MPNINKHLSFDYDVKSIVIITMLCERPHRVDGTMLTIYTMFAVVSCVHFSKIYEYCDSLAQSFSWLAIV